jgi:hypothetical protein
MELSASGFRKSSSSTEKLAEDDDWLDRVHIPVYDSATAKDHHHLVFYSVFGLFGLTSVSTTCGYMDAPQLPGKVCDSSG